jgi:hypothetical protein
MRKVSGNPFKKLKTFRFAEAQKLVKKAEEIILKLRGIYFIRL